MGCEGLQFLLLSTLIVGRHVDGMFDEGHFTNEFIVEIDGDNTVADLVAGTHGFNLLSHIQGLGNVYHFRHPHIEGRTKRSAEDYVSKLLSDPNVINAVQQRILHRTKREIVYDKQQNFPIHTYKDKSVYQRFYHENDKIVAKNSIPDGRKIVNFNDPYFKDQWYLINNGQTGGPVGLDVNVLPVWRQEITGKGVVVCILDDGIDHRNRDLEKNYDPKASTDLNGRKSDPMPNVKDAANSHGTRCAGEVAAEANNKMCGVGIAYNAKIGGVRMLDGRVTDGLEAEALLFNNQYIHIYSASWGPRDDGRTMEGPSHYAKQALEQGVKKGRNGLGSLFIWATGNGGMNKDTCSCDGYVSSIYTLSVGCIDDEGESTYFTEICPSTMAVIYTGGGHVPPYEERSMRPKLKVVTTDINQGCTLGFEGTSSAAPLAAGCFALVLEANPKLTWRDVQHIVVETAKITNNETGWIINGAGKHVNHKFGFGALDCGKMVEYAQAWKNVPEQHICKGPIINVNKPIISKSTVNISIVTHGCRGDSETNIDKLEHVEIHVKLKHSRRGDLLLHLISPSQTSSRMLQLRPNDDHTDGIDFTFMTVLNWGENPSGRWIFQVTDHPKDPSTINQGNIESVNMTLYGTSNPKREKKADSREEAYRPDDRTLEHIKQNEQEESKNVKIKKGKEPVSINPLLDKKLEKTSGNKENGNKKSKNGGSNPENLSQTEMQTLYSELHDRLLHMTDEKDRLLEDDKSSYAKKNYIPANTDNQSSNNDDEAHIDFTDLINTLEDIKRSGILSETKEDSGKSTDSYSKKNLSPISRDSSKSNSLNTGDRNIANDNTDNDIDQQDLDRLLNLASLLKGTKKKKVPTATLR